MGITLAYLYICYWRLYAYAYLTSVITWHRMLYVAAAVAKKLAFMVCHVLAAIIC
jgi:hypothetical protein